MSGYETLKFAEVYGRNFPRFSREEIHPAVSKILDKLPRGRLLDFPSGSGALAYRLYKEGFEVTACDLNPNNFIAEGVTIHQGDLCARFPFDDDTFEYATFVEGPEHAENPFFAIREFSRVLRSNGHLVITIPNYTSIESRLKFLLWGSSEKAITPELIQRKYGGEAAMAHITPLTYTQIRYFLEASGFDVVLVEKDKTKRKQFFLYPLVFIIQVITWLSGNSGQKKWWAREANATRILLGGNTLIVLARKIRDSRYS